MNNKTLYQCSIPPQNEKIEYSFYKFLKVIRIFCIIFSATSALYAFYFSNPAWLVTLFFVLCSVGLFYIGRNFYNFYDYLFVDDEVRLIKVINNKTRKVLAKFNVKHIEKIGFTNSLEYLKYKNNNNVKKIYAISKNYDGQMIYFLVNHEGENKIILLQFNSKFLYYVLNKTSRRVLDSNFNDNLKEYENSNLS